MAFAILSLMVLSMLRLVTCSAPADDCPKKPIAAAYYMPAPGASLSDVPWGKLNTAYYSFALSTPNVSRLSFDSTNGTTLPDFVNEARHHGVAPHAVIGGWTGSRFLSLDVGNQENRTAFVQTIAKLAKDYDLDGVQFDWEYPGKQGLGCNAISVNDTANFLAFLQELREDETGAKLILSVATPIVPFTGPSGTPITDVSAFAKILDYIMIMNYDVWGPWSSTVGPNAPLNDTCAVPANQFGSAVSAIKAWGNAGMPVGQMVLGLAAYGHSFSVAPSDAFMNGSKTDLAPYPKFNSSNQPLGDSDTSSAGGTNVCGVHEGPGGTFTFNGLVKNGFLNEDGKPADGIFYRFDDCSQTPYLYNQTSQVMISYDDVPSFAAKGQFIEDAGLAGFAMWRVGGDYHDLLLDSIESAMGFDANNYKRNWNL